MSNNLETAPLSEQPFAPGYREKLPVDFYLFVRRAMGGQAGPRFFKYTTSSFHNSTYYKIAPFYKSISNII
jgi:hypothetical protein